MRIAVLGATGQTGAQLVAQALARGHDVVALCREPARLARPAAAASASLEVRRVDALRPDELAAALAGVDALVSGLGNVRGHPAGVLAAAARAVVAAPPPRTVWLGAVGTVASRRAGGPLLERLLPLALGANHADKLAAEAALLTVGATLVHAGPLTNRPARGGARLVLAADAPRTWWPRTIARADVAALMLDEATTPRFAGTTAVASYRPTTRRAP